MNTMHELLMPELNELRIAGRQAEAEMRRWMQTASETEASRQEGGRELKLHLPRLRRGSTAGVA